MDQLPTNIHLPFHKNTVMFLIFVPLCLCSVYPEWPSLSSQPSKHLLTNQASAQVFCPLWSPLWPPDSWIYSSLGVPWQCVYISVLPHLHCFWSKFYLCCWISSPQRKVLWLPTRYILVFHHSPQTHCPNPTTTWTWHRAWNIVGTEKIRKFEHIWKNVRDTRCQVVGHRNRRIPKEKSSFPKEPWKGLMI